VVVQLHRRFVDGRLESGIVIGKGRKFEGHGELLLMVRFAEAQSLALVVGCTRRNTRRNIVELTPATAVDVQFRSQAPASSLVPPPKLSSRPEHHGFIVMRPFDSAQDGETCSLLVAAIISARANK